MLKPKSKVEPFQLLIKPVAADCNMKCSYCFYREKNALFGEGAHRMTDATLEKFISDYMQLGFDPAVFIWQGGEPTLAGLDFFVRAVELEKKYGYSGQSVGNAFQTNGLAIDDAWADFFREFRFLVGLSIDGPRELHDANRITLGGGESFTRAMRAADVLRKKGVAVNVLSVVSKSVVDKAKQVYRFFRNEGFGELQFIICLERDATGKIAKYCPTPEEYGKFLIELFDEWMKDGYPRISERIFESMIGSFAGYPPSLCTFAPGCGSYLVVEHNGEIYPCDFFVEPRWKCGEVEKAALLNIFKSGRKPEFQRIKPSPSAGCLKCKWWAHCRAGCVKDWVGENGSDAKKTYFCKSYKMFFEHAESDLKAIAREIVGEKPKPNEECYCGSGKKYKLCCMLDTR